MFPDPYTVQPISMGNNMTSEQLLWVAAVGAVLGALGSLGNLLYTWYLNHSRQEVVASLCPEGDYPTNIKITFNNFNNKDRRGPAVTLVEVGLESVDGLHSVKLEPRFRLSCLYRPIQPKGSGYSQCYFHDHEQEELRKAVEDEIPLTKAYYKDVVGDRHRGPLEQTVKEGIKRAYDGKR